MDTQLAVSNADLALVPTGVPLDGALEVYKASIADRAASTLVTYGRDLREFTSWLQDRGASSVRQITPGDLIAYKFPETRGLYFKCEDILGALEPVEPEDSGE